MVSEKDLICFRKCYWINKQTHSLRLAFCLIQHTLHSSSLFNVRLHRNSSTGVLCFFCLHCDCVCVSLLWCNLVGSLWAGCSPLYFFLTGRNCWNDGVAVQVWQLLCHLLVSSILVLWVWRERWWLLPYPWHECRSRRSPFSFLCSWIAVPSILWANILLSSCG